VSFDCSGFVGNLSSARCFLLVLITFTYSLKKRRKKEEEEGYRTNFSLSCMSHIFFFLIIKTHKILKLKIVLGEDHRHSPPSFDSDSNSLAAS